MNTATYNWLLFSIYFKECQSLKNQIISRKPRSLSMTSLALNYREEVVYQESRQKSYGKELVQWSFSSEIKWIACKHIHTRIRSQGRWWAISGDMMANTMVSMNLRENFGFPVGWNKKMLSSISGWGSRNFAVHRKITQLDYF